MLAWMEVGISLVALMVNVYLFLYTLTRWHDLPIPKRRKNILLAVTFIVLMSITLLRRV